MRLTSSSEDSNIKFVPRPGGVKIPVRVYGLDGSKTPLIMLHGLQSHSGWFVQSASFIASLGIPVYAMDRYGSGLSEAPKGSYRSLEESIEDINTVARHAIEVHKKEKVYILGHCYGAMQAAAFACVHNDKVESLILPTPAIFTKCDVSLIEKLKILWSKISGQDVRIPVPLDSEMMSDLDEYVTFIKNDKLSLQDATGKFFLEVGRMRNFITKEAHKITAPVFMAFAGKDPICRNDRNKRFFDSLKSTKKILKTYNQTRHILEFSVQKDEFFKNLVSWLKGFDKIS